MTSKIHKSQIDKIVRSFSSAIKNSGLYPAGHPAVQKSLVDINESFSPVLDKWGELIIALVDDVLVVADSPCYENEHPFYESLSEELSARDIEKIVFSRTLEPNELIILMQFFREKLATLKVLEDPNDYLASRGVKYIEFEKVVDEESETRRVYNEALETIESILGDVRMGRIPDTNKAKKSVQSMLDRVLKDRNTLIGLTNIKNYDNYLFNHSVNVCILTLSLSQSLNIYDRYLEDVGIGALLHDIGKTDVPIEVMNKPGKLNDQEWQTMKQHPILGVEIVSNMENISSLSKTIIFQHHIDYIEGGYPPLPPGDKLNPLTRVVTIADCYDALTTLRVYQRSHSPIEAIRIMKGLSGKRFDPKLLNEFFRIMGVYPQGALVRLDTNEIAIVTKLSYDEPLRPTVKMIRGPRGEILFEPIEVDLSKERDASGNPLRNIVSTVNPLTKNIDASSYLA